MSTHPSPYLDLRAVVARHGITPAGVVYRNLGVDALIQASVQRGQGTVLANGALHQDSRPNVGRAAKSSFYVKDPDFEYDGRTLDDLLAWGDPAEGRFDNLPIAPAIWDKLHQRVVDHLSQAGDLYVTDAWSGRTRGSRMAVRVITCRAPGALFARHIFLRPTPDELHGFDDGFQEADGWTILQAPDAVADPEDGTNGSTFIITHLGRRITIIGGTAYHGQIKKAIFSVQNFRLPLRGILTMHAGASEGHSGLSALHAGLSGTGKTTLSNTGHPVADDQIVIEIDGSPDAVVSNMEGGQYAKTEKLRHDKEPEIWEAIRYGAAAENIWHGPDGVPDYDNLTWTANGRVGYPLSFVPSAKASGCARAPRNITFLTADGFGVLPPVARLSVEAAKFHFAAGFTSKMPGTEKGVVEPKPTFSAFFGKPFMPLKPAWYMNLLADLITRHGTQVWLVNTGWLGPNVAGRHRVDILVSKAIINAVRDGHIDLSPENFWYDPIFKVEVPRHVPGVSSAMLDPRHAWESPQAWHEAANQLAAIFQEAVGRMPHMPAEVLAAGPAPQ